MTIDIDPKDIKPAAPPPLDVLDKHSNQAFFIRFGIVVFLLHALAGGLVVTSRVIGQQSSDENLRRELVEQRIAPVGKIATSQEQLTALAPMDVPVAPRTGDQVVQEVCAACHASGMLGAPKMHDKAAWQARTQAAGGREALVASAIKGKGQMPPRGGLSNLSDQEVADAIDAML